LPNEFTKRLKKERNSKRTIATETHSFSMIGTGDYENPTLQTA
jgi:hypothetical protein